MVMVIVNTQEWNLIKQNYMSKRKKIVTTKNTIKGHKKLTYKEDIPVINIYTGQVKDGLVRPEWSFNDGIKNR
jgi:hypothetical protein